jgi:hypothetical protein
MGSVATSSFSLSNLLQSITSTASPQLASTLSSPRVQAALQNAPAGDVIELSDQALRLQEDNALFGTSSTGTPSVSSDLSNILALTQSASSAAATSSPSSSASETTPSLSNQLDGYQADLQSQELQSLFGLTASSPSLSSLFDITG